MASFVKPYAFLENLAKGTMNLSTDTFKVALTNTAMSQANDAFYADFTDLATAGGYTAGGNAVTGTLARTDGVTTFSNTDPAVWTATAAGIGPFRYAVLYDDTEALPADQPILGWWDYGSAITMAEGETLTVDFGASTFTLE